MNCTVANNAAHGNAAGGGLHSQQGGEEGPLIRNSIFANNLADSQADDIGGKVRSRDYNLIEATGGFDLSGAEDHNITGEDPSLGELSAETGERTATHALQSDSPAIDAGSCTDVVGALVRADQRGVKRPQGSHCDIGAYELAQPRLTVDKLVDDPTAEPGQQLIFTIVVGNTGAAAATGGTISDTLPAGLNLSGSVVLEPPAAGTTYPPPRLVRDLTISAGERVTVTLPVTVSASLPTPTTITNTAAVTSDQISVPQVGSRRILVTRGVKPSVYLPMVTMASY